MCNYVETDLDLTQTLMGATVVHVKEDVLRLEVAAEEQRTASTPERMPAAVSPEARPTVLPIVPIARTITSKGPRRCA